MAAYAIKNLSKMGAKLDNLWVWVSPNWLSEEPTDRFVCIIPISVLMKISIGVFPFGCRWVGIQGTWNSRGPKHDAKHWFETGPGPKTRPECEARTERWMEWGPRMKVWRPLSPDDMNKIRICLRES
jgi:hypothetical protein